MNTPDLTALAMAVYEAMTKPEEAQSDEKKNED